MNKYLCCWLERSNVKYIYKVSKMAPGPSEAGEWTKSPSLCVCGGKEWAEQQEEEIKMYAKWVRWWSLPLRSLWLSNWRPTYPTGSQPAAALPLSLNTNSNIYGTGDELGFKGQTLNVTVHVNPSSHLPPSSILPIAHMWGEVENTVVFCCCIFYLC